jgi:hypothetical protein
MILTLLFFVPFIANILSLILYIYAKKFIYRRIFFITAFIGFGLLGGAIVFSTFIPVLYNALDFPLLFWIFSGYLLILSIFIKIMIFKKVFIRYKDPRNFHYNFFGKKVMHSGFMTNREMRYFFVSMPLFLFAGAYFIARLINLIRHGHL